MGIFKNLHSKTIIKNFQLVKNFPFDYFLNTKAEQKWSSSWTHKIPKTHPKQILKTQIRNIENGRPLIRTSHFLIMTSSKTDEKKCFMYYE